MNEILLFLIIASLIWLIWRAIGAGSTTQPANAENPTKTPPKEDPQSRYLRDTLAFAKAQHRELAQKQRAQAAWQHHHGLKQVQELDQLDGVEFEEYFAGLFRSHGYATELTPTTGDYGADLVLTKNGQRIVVQAKRYIGSVGIAAVQEALSGMAYYQCHSAWVVTTGNYTPNAVELAGKSGVRLIGRADLGKLMLEMANGGGA